MIELKNIFDRAVNKVKENPGTLLGMLYPYVFIIIVIIGLYYIANLDNVADQKIPAVTPDTSVTKTLQLADARIVPPIDIFKYKEPAPELILKGKNLYNSICASCHNETGAGGGPASVGLNPAPRNFTSPDGWKNGRTLSGIYTTLQEGIEGSSMIAYNYMTPEERIAIAHYLRSEFMTDAPLVTDEELAALDQLYSLSEGVKIPAQIPVNSALEILALESEQKLKKIEDAIATIERDKSVQAVRIFDYVAADKKLAVSSLALSENWKESENEFINFLALNVNQNGFNGRIFNLSDDELNLLYNYIKNLL